MEGVEIEVGGQIASNTGIAIPEGGIFSTYTTLLRGIVLLVAWTGQTTIRIGFVVLVRLAGYALFSIEVRILIRTRSTGTEVKVIYLAERTRKTQFFAEIEVLRKEAGHAYLTIPEVAVLAFTCLTFLVVGLSQWASFAILAFRVEVGGRHTSCTLIAIEIWQVSRAVHTLLR